MEFDTRRGQQSEIRFNPKAFSREGLKELVTSVALRSDQAEILVRKHRPDGTVANLLTIPPKGVAHVSKVFGKYRKLYLEMLLLVFSLSDEVIITSSPKPATGDNL